MKMIQIDYHGSVAVVKLARSITNALNLQLITELQESLDKVNQDPDVHGIVISSSNDKFFSIGLDIPQLYPLSEKDFMNFYQVFNQVQIDLYTVPKPTVAAVTGHAVAGGCVLALCCDYRFISEGRKFMGLNEIKLGVSIPYPADCILRNVVGTRVARNIVDSGEFYLPEQLLATGLVDCVLPLEDVLPKSIEKAHMVGALPLKAFASIKQSRVEQVEAQIKKLLKEKEELFVKLWFSDEAREQLRKAMEKF
ncbi:MAG: enoyl-CoA hydratase/isomerase family protein [Theionarchaea archaeon]|nr:enoyl-CoA hydratase/isomerase family protein [Theionarchaea archaeon]